mgnify:FL=1
MFIIGVLVGVLLCIFLAILQKREEKTITHIFKKAVEYAKIQPKGEIIEESEDERAEFLSQFEDEKV